MDGHVAPCAAAILLAVSLVAACQPNPNPTPAPIPAPNPRPNPNDPSPSDPTVPQIPAPNPIPTPNPNGQPGRRISPQAQIVTQRDVVMCRELCAGIRSGHLI
jgi:hypothetical protein